MSAGTMMNEKGWELTKSDSIRADSAHNVRVALEKMDARIERGDGAMAYRIYNRHVAQWQTHYLDNRGLRGLRLGIRNMFGFTPTHRAVREAVEGRCNDELRFGMQAAIPADGLSKNGRQLLCGCSIELEAIEQADWNVLQASDGTFHLHSAELFVIPRSLDSVEG